MRTTGGRGVRSRPWNRRAPMPERPPEEAVLRDCMGESTRSMLSENAAMKERLGEMATQRDAMMAERDAVRGHEEEARKQFLASEVEARKQLLTSHDKLADYLGQAANKAQEPATATASATSDSAGTAHTESAHDATTSLAAETAAAPPPAMVVTTAPATPPPANAAAGRGRALPARGARRRPQRGPVHRPRPDRPLTAALSPPGEREMAGNDPGPDRDRGG